MIPFSFTLWTWPFSLAVCLLDTWLVFALLLLAAQGLAGDRWNSRNSLLHLIVEGPVQASQRRLTKWRGRSWPTWACWAVTFGVVITTRQTLAVLLNAIS